MTFRKKTIWRFVLLAVLAVVVAGVAAPYFRIDSFAQQIRAGLKQALGREVEIGEVTVNLFGGPGFSVSDVTIHEDPRVGIEPIAYVSSLEARVSFASLWTRRLQFSSLRLNEPSINLVKFGAGWNFEPLLTRTVGAATAGERRSAVFPNILVRGGRVNFKFGDVKSVFYITEPEIDLFPPSEGTPDWRFRFSGEPARSDRAARGFGEFTGNGRWRPEQGGGNLEANLIFARSRISEMVSLLHGHDVGVHGIVSSRVRITGSVSDLRIEGKAEIADIHRWDLLPATGEQLPIDFRGRLDLVSQIFEIQTSPQTGISPGFSLRFRALNYLSEPEWGVIASFGKLPLKPIPALMRRLGLPVPDDLAAVGEIDAVVGCSSSAGLRGKAFGELASLSLPGSSAVQVRNIELLVDGNRIRVLGGTINTATQAETKFAVEYARDSGALRSNIQAQAVKLSELRSGIGRLHGGSTLPVSDSFLDAICTGELTFARASGEPGQWSGDLLIEDARVLVPGTAEPLALQSAHVVVRDGGVLLNQARGVIGKSHFAADYRFRPKAARPHQFRISSAQLDAADIERLFLPTLKRRRGFLSQALRFGAAGLPDWLETRKVDIALQAARLTVGTSDLEKVRAKLTWDGGEIEVADLEAGWGEGSILAHGALSLRRPLPSYRFTTEFRDIAWREAKWDGHSSIQTSGIGSDLMRNLNSEGAFRSRSILLGPNAELKSVSGAYSYGLRRGVPVIVFKGVQATLGQDTFQGHGSTRDDGRLYIELTDGHKQMKMIGTLLPFQMELISTPH